MQHESVTGVSRIGAAEHEAGEDERKPLVKSPALVTLITKEFKNYERIEEDIGEKRQDQKECIKRMVAKGCSKRGVKAALMRRKLVVKGGLEQMDETLALICGIAALGIQGELFQWEEEPADGA